MITKSKGGFDTVEVKALNQQLDMDNKEIESIITELLEREEFNCTMYTGGMCNIN